MTNSHTNQEEEKISSIPKIIHFIWLGGPIPENYLRSILDLSLVAKRSGFIVNLWVDDPQNYQKTANKIENKIQADLPKNIKIRNIHEIQSLMAEDPFFKKDKRNKQYWIYSDLERVGFKNLGAASDFLRYAILYLMGGYYFDTDTEFDFSELKNKTLIADNPSYGFMVDGNLCYRIYRNKWCTDPDFANAVIREVEYEMGRLGNDIIAAVPKNSVLEYTILEVMNKYSELTKNENKKTLAAKRFPFNTKLFQERARLTIECSGPSALAVGIENYIKNLISVSKSPKEQLDKIHDLKNVSIGCRKYAGLYVTSHSHQTWLQKEFDIILMSENNFAEEKFLDNHPILVKCNDGSFKFRGRMKDKWQLTVIKDKKIIPKEWDFSGKIKITIKPQDNIIYKALTQLHTPSFLKKDIQSFDDSLPPKSTL